jgi:Protein of unknown function (DUF2510)
VSIPEPPRDSAPPAGWYPTGEVGTDGYPLERWWDGAQWSTTVRPLGIGTNGPRRGSRAKPLIALGVVVVLVGGGIGAYFALHQSSPTSAASSTSQSTPTPGRGNGGLGGGNGGLGGGGGLGGLGGPTASPAPTITGGSGQTVSDPIDGLTVPVPSGWTAIAGSLSGQGTWPALSTGPYTCPSALSQANGSSSAPCTRGGVSFATTAGSGAQSVATSDIATLAKGNYGNLASHNVVSQGAVTVAGRAGYQVTWSVVPNYSGPSGTVEAIAIPVPGQSGYFTLIDIGVDQDPQAPSLSSVNAQIISNITSSGAAGA